MSATFVVVAALMELLALDFYLLSAVPTTASPIFFVEIGHFACGFVACGACLQAVFK